MLGLDKKMNGFLRKSTKLQIAKLQYQGKNQN